MEYYKRRTTTFPRKSLQSFPKVFYQTGQIRFRQLARTSLPRKQKTVINFNNNPWTSLKQEEVDAVVLRLQDPPQKILQFVEKKIAMKQKFKLIKICDKQNSKQQILKNINKKKLMYEQEYRNLLHKKKTSTFNVLLPQLDQVKYVYKDILHNIGTSESTVIKLCQNQLKQKKNN